MLFLYSEVYLEKERGRLSYFSNKILYRSRSKRNFFFMSFALNRKWQQNKRWALYYTFSIISVTNADLLRSQDYRKSC